MGLHQREQPPSENSDAVHHEPQDAVPERPLGPAASRDERQSQSAGDDIDIDSSSGRGSFLRGLGRKSRFVHREVEARHKEERSERGTARRSPGAGTPLGPAAHVPVPRSGVPAVQAAAAAVAVAAAIQGVC